ncbi:protein O-mannosyl-transferase TMTC2-like [Hyaena hyaena]|uniref:protein O-mannosyl-transferase TMTC2-like n=1 Tax=Hyaena hyaena TaxID=95912 RepID=UPI001920F37B|nr:protein O-mannosyl-transferase TMTC2-like [Hyaena hyaena]
MEALRLPFPSSATFYGVEGFLVLLSDPAAKQLLLRLLPFHSHRAAFLTIPLGFKLLQQVCQLSCGRKSEAEKFFLKAIELDPTKGNCYMHYGQFLLEEARLIEAAEMAKKAAELDSTEFDVVFSAAHMLRQASLNEAAEKYYDLAARLRPNYPAALMNLGAILHLNGRLQKAEANYLRALQLKPDDVITQSNLRKLWNIMEKQGLKTSKT